MTAYEAYTRAAEIAKQHMNECLRHGDQEKARTAATIYDAILALRDVLPSAQNDIPASDPCVREECCRLRKLINEHYGPENSRLKDELLALSEKPASGTAKVPEGMVLVSIDEIDRIARDCEHGSRIWRVCDAICRRYRLAAAPTGNEEGG